jgi:glutathione S-transferase
MLKIWGRANSINVQKVLWCCAELGLPFERIDAGMKFGVNNTPEYKAMNPNGLIPTIDDDGFVLWESQAIVRYLARKHGFGSLCPADPKTCADADRWMDWYATTPWPNLQPIFWNLVRTPPEQRNMTLVAELTKKVAAAMVTLEAQLAGRSYITGETFTMGDIPIGCAIMRWLNLPLTREPQPNIEAYYKRLQTRPAYRQWANVLPLT